MRTRARVGLVGAAAAVLVGTVSGVAWADNNVHSCTASPSDDGGRDCSFWFYKEDGNTQVGYAGFQAYGEHLIADDSWTDGRGVFVSASWSGGYKEIWATGGNGDYENVDLSIGEGVSVTVTACQTDNGALLNCATQTSRA
ncbi:hypothetical protein OG381_15710 [Streptomyces sp. NBC_00490]|uniref:hypothetical protein n=1 Tax=Streptomyces sp. NBC_00490 TaxID=2903657 RepID=UPI002E184067